MIGTEIIIGKKIFVDSIIYGRLADFAGTVTSTSGQRVYFLCSDGGQTKYVMAKSVVFTCDTDEEVKEIQRRCWELYGRYQALQDDEAITKELFRGQLVGSYLRKTVDQLIKTGINCLTSPSWAKNGEREMVFISIRLSNLVPQNWPTPEAAESYLRSLAEANREENSQ